MGSSSLISSVHRFPRSGGGAKNTDKRIIRRPQRRRTRARCLHPPMHSLIALIALGRIAAILFGTSSTDETSEGSSSSSSSNSYLFSSSQPRLKPTENNNHGNNIRKKTSFIYPTSYQSPQELVGSRGNSIKLSSSVQTDGFLDWCRSALGIETILEIQTFEYYDYLQDILTENSLDEWDATTYEYHNMNLKEGMDKEPLPSPPPRPPLIPVRGLAASRHISVGETVIRIPLHGLLSVKTTIDEDPFLSPLMGPDARQKHGWDIVSSPDKDEEIAFLYELSLLAVAIMYHRSLGNESPLAPYIKILEESNVDSMPFLWSRDKIQTTALPAGIRDVALGIRRDIRDMYQTVVQVLIEQHPDIFGNTFSGEVSDDDWMFSFTNFQWAFAVVNSRHWQLPIEDLNEEEKLSPDDVAPQMAPKQQALLEDQVPPADMPTETWVKEQEEIDDARAVDDDAGGRGRQVNFLLEHSFLSPVADLLNFGPSCTQGRYDAKSHTFEIVASCPFRKGQEVTFWYSDECVDVIVGMYGFSHPMIPSCPTLEEAQLQEELWRQRAEELEKQLEQVYKELDEAHDELDFAEAILEQCDCCVYDRPSSRSRSSRKSRDASSADRRSERNVRGSRTPSRGQSDVDRHHGVRRMKMIYSRRSEF